MTMALNNDNFLERAFALQDAPAAKGLYDEWASSYDEWLGGVRYASPRRTVEAILKHVNTSGSSKILVLDAGCGTGLVGQALASTPIADRLIIDGNDISPGMLDKARVKGVYRKLDVVDLTKTLDVSESTYDIVSCVGTLTKGHVGPAVLHEFLRITKTGGIVAATVHGDIWVSGGYKSTVDRLVSDGKAEALATEPFGILESNKEGAIMVVLRKSRINA